MGKGHEIIVYETKVFNDVWYKSEFVQIQGSLIIIATEFDSDGCTCAKDSSSNKVGCRVHDALLRCLREIVLLRIKSNLTRWQCDRVLYEALRRSRFRLWGWVLFSPTIYYLGVSLNSIRKVIFK